MESFWKSIGAMGLMWACHGCSYRETPREQFDRDIHELRKETDLGLMWYLGSADDDHYVKYVYGMFAESWYRIRADELPIDAPFPFTHDDSKWVVLKKHDDPWPLPTPLKARPRD